MVSNSSSRFTKVIFGLILLTTLSVIIYNFYTFYYLRDYTFLVEASCDPQEQSCYIRSCTEEGECPPNGLEQFRMFEINASNFDKCSDNSCANECIVGSIECEEIPCDEDNGDTCSRIETLTNQDSSDIVEE
jgi:hypothetical protein